MSISVAMTGRVAVEREQDDVDEAVGGLDLGPLVALEDVLDDQRMEAEAAPTASTWAGDGPTEVDPDTRRRARASIAGSASMRRVAIELMERASEPSP